jgi:glutamine amidotransferase
MRTNCHPFVYQKWSFAHNGQIGGFQAMQRPLEALLSDDLYHARQGSTDSELLFLLLLQFGLSESVDLACGKVISLLEKMRKKMLITEPLRIAVVAANGTDLFALRYASDQHSPTLYRSKQLDNGGIAIASEPLDKMRHNWVPIMPSRIVSVNAGGVVLDRALSIS